MSLLDACLKPFWKLQKLILPTVRFPQFDYEDVLTEFVPAGADWLEVGCGHQIIPDWRIDQEVELTKRCRTVVGLDYDMPSLHKHATIELLVRGDVTMLPFANDSFDLITANMVVEHLEDPVSQFHEIHRVLRPGGKFIFHTPNVWGYKTILSRMVPGRMKSKFVLLFEGREEEDLFPAYYRINSRKRIGEVAEDAGFECPDVRMIQGEATAILILLLPILLLEMLWIKLLLLGPFAPLRGNIITILKKPVA